LRIPAVRLKHENEVGIIDTELSVVAFLSQFAICLNTKLLKVGVIICPVVLGKNLFERVKINIRQCLIITPRMTLA